MEHAIDVCGVGKRFRLRAGGGRTLKSAAIDLLRPGRRAARQFWALKDISFQVGRGETLGLIGSNGAGKSTLLSLLAGTKVPTTGSIQTQGTISSLLELGAGFHPDLTGRENVYLAGAIMGLSRDQMNRRFDAIAEFAGIGEFLDQPVKHYSSGMYVRLGFAVAVEVDPDILLIDEVLAVGDVQFQRKCIAKMDEFRKRGKTMLIISHDLPTIQKISDRILLLESGNVAGIGTPDEVVGTYQSRSRRESLGGLEREWGSGEVRILAPVFRNAAGEATDTYRWGEPLEIELGYEASEVVVDPVFGFALSDAEGRLVYGNNTQIEGVRIERIEGRGCLKLRFDELNLAPGDYLFSFSVHSADHQRNYHRLDHSFSIHVICDRPFEGVCHMQTQWRIST